MDLLNLKRKDTSYAADVEIGDLIKVKNLNHKRLSILCSNLDQETLESEEMFSQKET